MTRLAACVALVLMLVVLDGVARPRVVIDEPPEMIRHGTTLASSSALEQSVVPEAPLEPTQNKAHRGTVQPETPPQHAEPKAPHKSIETKAPHKPTEDKAHEKSAEPKAPHKSTEDKAPHNSIETKAPHKPTEDKAEHKSTEDKAHEKSAESKAVQQQAEPKKTQQQQQAEPKKTQQQPAETKAPQQKSAEPEAVQSSAKPEAPLEPFSLTRSLPMLDRMNIPADAGRWDGNETNQFHLILAYPQGPRDAYLCTLESLLTVLDKTKNPSRVNVWVDAAAGLPEYARGHPRLVERPFNFYDVIAGTPLQKLFGTKAYPNTRLGTYGQQNKANGMRLAILYREGGFYLDSDFVVLRDPTTMGLGVGSQGDTPNNAAMFFPKESPVIHKMMEMFVASYQGDWWGYNGPELWGRFIKMCMRRFGAKWATASGGVVTCGRALGQFTVWPKVSTSSISWVEVPQKMALPMNEVSTKLNPADERVKLVHLWHSASYSVEEALCKKGPGGYLHGFVGALRKQHCPVSTARAVRQCKFRRLL